MVLAQSTIQALKIKKKLSSSSYKELESFLVFENLFKLRQLYLQPQICALSNLRLAS